MLQETVLDVKIILVLWNIEQKLIVYILPSQHEFTQPSREQYEKTTNLRKEIPITVVYVVDSAPLETFIV
jgi:hypothetical protein